MAKHDRRETSGQAPDSQPITIQVPLPVLGVVHGVREAFHGLCIATGLQVLEAMMEADREALCGPKGRHQVERSAWRGGSADSPVTLGGRQVAVPRLRVRSAGCEVPLVGFQRASVFFYTHPEAPVPPRIRSQVPPPPSTGTRSRYGLRNAMDYSHPASRSQQQSTRKNSHTASLPVSLRCHHPRETSALLNVVVIPPPSSIRTESPRRPRR